MQKKQITLINKLGLHARAAMKLMNTASRYGSEILIRFDGRVINAKDIMDVLILGASCGSILEFEISGDDEDEALNALVALIEDRLGESE